MFVQERRIRENSMINTTKKVLLLGANGYLGSNIYEYCKKLDIVHDSFTNIAYLNEITNAIKKSKPDILINCAAQTDEDRAETDIVYWERMIHTNILGAINCLKACKDNNVLYCHIKTPFEVAPVDDYSLSKIAASEFVDAKKYEGITYRILPGWFYGGVQSKQFDQLLVRSIKDKFPLGITNNSYCVPVYMSDFCERLEKIILCDAPGLYPISATSKCTRYEFANCLAKTINKTMKELMWSENNNFEEAGKRPYDWSVYGDLPSYHLKMEDFVQKHILT